MIVCFAQEVESCAQKVVRLERSWQEPRGCWAARRQQELGYWRVGHRTFLWTQTAPNGLPSAAGKQSRPSASVVLSSQVAAQNSDLDLCPFALLRNRRLPHLPLSALAGKVDEC